MTKPMRQDKSQLRILVQRWIYEATWHRNATTKRRDAILQLLKAAKRWEKDPAQTAWYMGVCNTEACHLANIREIRALFRADYKVRYAALRKYAPIVMAPNTASLLGCVLRDHYITLARGICEEGHAHLQLFKLKQGL